MESINIGLIGLSGSTKSHVIAMLIHLVNQGTFGKPTGFRNFYRSSPLDAERYRSEYYDPLIARHEMIEPSQSMLASGRVATAPSSSDDANDGTASVAMPEPVNLPLVYVLEFDRPAQLMDNMRTIVSRHVLRRQSSRTPSRNVLLTLYDAPGEDLANPFTRNLYYGYSRHADGLIFLIDPLVIDTIRSYNDDFIDAIANGLHSRDSAMPFEVHKKRVNDNYRSEMLKTTELLHSLADGWLNSRGRPTFERCPIPIAIVLAKSDMVRSTARGEFHDTFLTLPVRYDVGYNKQEALTQSQEVESFLRSINAGDVVMAASRFERVWFHVISATGRSPINRAFPGGLTPFRVVSPLADLLFDLKVIHPMEEIPQPVPAHRRMGGRQDERRPPAPLSPTPTTPQVGDRVRQRRVVPDRTGHPRIDIHSAPTDRLTHQAGDDDRIS